MTTTDCPADGNWYWRGVVDGRVGSLTTMFNEYRPLCPILPTSEADWLRGREGGLVLYCGQETARKLAAQNIPRAPVCR